MSYVIWKTMLMFIVVITGGLACLSDDIGMLFVCGFFCFIYQGFSALERMPETIDETRREER